MVFRRPSSEVIQSLRVTLQKLEENFPAPEDQPVIEELRRLLLLRIAQLESATKSNSTEECPEGVESPVVWVRLRSER